MVARQSGDTMSAGKGFSKLSYLKDLRGHDMPDGAYRVLVAVFNYTNARGANAHPGEARLADDTGMSERSVRRHLKWLTDNDYLIKGKRGHGKSAATPAMATVYELGRPTGQIAQATGQMRRPTGQIASTYGQYCPTPLSDPVPDPLSDHEQAGDPWPDYADVRAS
jgi:DNA-binding transcriptional ArsR family regulator